MDDAVVIVGGGPTGLMLAGELALAGVAVTVLERRASQALAGTRAGGLHARTIEIFDMRGIADRFLSQGRTGQAVAFAGAMLDLGDLPTRHPYVLALGQDHIERILADWVRELGVPIAYGAEVTAFTHDDDGVDVTVADGRTLRTEFLVGCDGGRSFVRKAAGIAFPGSDPTTSNLIAEVEMAVEPAWGLRRDERGINSIAKMDDGRVRVLVTEREVGPNVDPTLRELSEALSAVYGTDFGVHSPTWLSRFTDMTRQAATYRMGRVLVAGDAAHVHPPDGGQGLQLGIQDAVNLGWKLARVVKRTSPPSLLDTYHGERHPAAARVLRTTMAQVTLRRPDERTAALRDLIGELLTMDEPRRRFAAMVAGLDIHYDLGAGHPLVGRRMPDLDLITATGNVRVFDLLRAARPLSLRFDSAASSDERVPSLDVTSTGPWDLPVLGRVAAPSAVLIRPDGHVAWVGDAPGLTDALTA